MVRTTNLVGRKQNFVHQIFDIKQGPKSGHILLYKDIVISLSYKDITTLLI